MRAESRLSNYEVKNHQINTSILSLIELRYRSVNQIIKG